MNEYLRASDKLKRVTPPADNEWDFCGVSCMSDNRRLPKALFQSHVTKPRNERASEFVWDGEANILLTSSTMTRVRTETTNFLSNFRHVSSFQCVPIHAIMTRQIMLSREKTLLPKIQLWCNLLGYVRREYDERTNCLDACDVISHNSSSLNTPFQRVCC